LEGLHIEARDIVLKNRKPEFDVTVRDINISNRGDDEPRRERCNN